MRRSDIINANTPIILQTLIHANNIIMHAFINNTFYSLCNNLCPGGVSLRTPIVRVVHVVNQRGGLLSRNRQAEIPPFEERIVLVGVVVGVIKATTMVARMRRGGELEGRTRATLRAAAAGGGSEEREGCTHDGACPFKGVTVVFRGIFSLEKRKRGNNLSRSGTKAL